MDFLEAKPVKVLVSGDCCGEFETLFKKVKQANDKAGPFDLLLCVGEFFSPTHAEGNKKLLQGEYIPCIPTYIMGPCTPQTSMFYPEEEGAELTANITYLGHKGTLTTAQGISIAYLSGVEGQDDCMENEFNGNTVRELLVPISASDYSGVDILLTCQWPENVQKYCSIGLKEKQLEAIKEAHATSALISRVAAVARPRYHFAGLGGVHYERLPYRNHRVLQEMTQHCTRFVGLAKVGNTDKAKSLYAFNVKPMKKMKRNELTEQPPDASEFPYANTLAELTMKESLAKPKGDSAKQYFFNEAANMDEEEGGRRRKGKRNFPGQDGPGGPGAKREPAGPCWFCLSSPQVEKHLVVAIGDCCYVALAKGGLCDDHVLILPIAHVQSTVQADKSVREEIDGFKKALTHYFADHKKSVVFYERNYRTQHLQIQAVPVPPQAETNLKNAFLNESELKGFELNKLEEEVDIWDMVNEGCPYFLLQLPNGERYFTRQMKGFPIMFGREVIAGPACLNIPDKVDWKQCKVAQSTEMKWANTFKNAFKKYDPNEI